MATIIVRDIKSKRPIKGIQVRIESETHSWESYTDNKGIARFPTLRDGKYVVKVRSNIHKYRPFTEKMYISRKSIIEIDLMEAFD